MTIAREIRAEALRRMDEIKGNGCEASSARSYYAGRLSVLDALELGLPPTPDATIKQRRQELDEALGTGKLRGSVDDEPIVAR